jgi:hypothetical protein
MSPLSWGKSAAIPLEISAAPLTDAGGAMILPARVVGARGSYPAVGGIV